MRPPIRNRVRVTRGGNPETYAAGHRRLWPAAALSSALLLLRSASDKHTKGPRNGSDQVGRNYMRHISFMLMALMREPNETVVQKDPPP